MIIGQIKDGIVLDHITAGRGMEIYNILGLGKLDCTVAMIKNADSEKKGRKDSSRSARSSIWTLMCWATSIRASP